MKTFAPLLASLFITTSCTDFVTATNMGVVNTTPKNFEHKDSPNYWSQGDLMFFGKTKHCNVSLFLPPKIESSDIQVEAIIFNNSNKPINISSENFAVIVSGSSGASLKIFPYSPEETNRVQRIEEVTISSKDIIGALRNHDDSGKEGVRYTREDRLFSDDPYMETVWLRKSTIFPGQSIRGIIQFNRLNAAKSSLEWEFEFQEGTSKVTFPVKIVDRSS